MYRPLGGGRVAGGVCGRSFGNDMGKCFPALASFMRPEPGGLRQLGGGRNSTSCCAERATTSSGFWSAIASMAANRS